MNLISFEQFNLRARNFWVSIFFIALILIGLGIYKDFGYTRDEIINRTRGVETAQYLRCLVNTVQVESVNSSASLFSACNYSLAGTEGEHGAIFETAAYFLEGILLGEQQENERAIYQLRHILIYCAFLIGVFAVFLMAQRRFSDWRIALLAALMLVLSPRIFGNAFYNSMDIVFLTVMAVAVNAMIGMLIKPSLKNCVIAAVTAAIAIDIRILGVMVPAGLFFIGLIQMVLPNKKSWLNLRYGFFYILTLLVGLIVFWPWLWINPFGRFLQAFQVMSLIPFELSVLYFGKIISTFAIPWHYIPIWIGISTPIFYLFIWLVGFWQILMALMKSGREIWRDNNDMQDLIFLGLLLAPIFAVILFHSAIYDSWRHLFFVYPFFILVAVRGWLVIWAKFYQKSWLRWLMGLAFAASFIVTSIWMVRAHPLEGLYFNTFAGKNWKSRFDVDYWSSGVQSALEYIIRHDSRAFVRVGSVSVMTDFGGMKMMDPTERARVVGVSADLFADYMIQIYRTTPVQYPPKGSPFTLFHEIKAGDETIISIYKNQFSGPPPPISLNERIDFSKGGKGVHYLIGTGAQEIMGWGWYHPEPWGVWAAGEKASLILSRPSVGTPKKLVLDFNALISPKHPKQQVKIRANGEGWQTVNMIKATGNLVTIALTQKIPLNYVELEFVFPDRIMPSQIGMGEDQRLLSVGLVSAVYQ